MASDYFKDRPGFVYLLQSDFGCKIGHAQNPAARTRSISTILPFPSKLIHALRVRDVIKAEALFHAIFSDERIRGEWFNLTDMDVAFFCSAGECSAMQQIGGILPTVNSTPYRHEDYFPMPDLQTEVVS